MEGVVVVSFAFFEAVIFSKSGVGFTQYWKRNQAEGLSK